MSSMEDYFERNRNWAESIKRRDPEFFANLARQQTPQLLWIGCADSRVAANQIIDVMPGAVFVHRNIANVVVHSDLNCLSVLQFAVEVLRVKDIVVCGHYGCGGVEAALSKEAHGLIDNWLGHIKDVYRLHTQRFEGLETQTEKINLLCELNVLEQVRNVCASTIVSGAWRKGQDLSVHGWIYSIEEGLLKSLCEHLAPGTAADPASQAP